MNDTALVTVYAFGGNDTISQVQHNAIELIHYGYMLCTIVPKQNSSMQNVCPVGNLYVIK